MTNAKWEERILAVPRETLFENEELAFQGTATEEELIGRLMNNIGSDLMVVRRGGGHKDSEPAENNAEINYDLKQPIPYAILRRGNEIYAYERLSGGGEERLHNMVSLGLGGHMNLEPTATSFMETLYLNLARELEEEVDIQASENYEMKVVGFINDDLNDVGRVHIGVLVVIDLEESATVEVRETEQLRGYWTNLDELNKPEVYERLEAWSQITVNALSK